MAGSRYFCERFFQGSCSKNQQKTTRPPMPWAAPYPYTSRFASNLAFLVLGYDCTRISDLKFKRISSGHNGLFALLLLIVLACLKHFESDRFCKRRFDLFSISHYCYTIVGERVLSQPAAVIQGSRVPESVASVNYSRQ